MQDLWNFFSIAYILFHVYWMLDKPNRDKIDEINKMMKEIRK